MAALFGVDERTKKNKKKISKKKTIEKNFFERSVICKTKLKPQNFKIKCR